MQGTHSKHGCITVRSRKYVGSLLMRLYDATDSKMNMVGDAFEDCEMNRTRRSD
jgi:hypothetical protein